VKLEGQFSRKELARALGLGEMLIAVALVVLAPVVRGETAYGAVHSVLPRTLAGDAYFLIVLTFLGAMVLVRTLAAGRLKLPEPMAVALLGIYLVYVAVRASFSDHPYAAQRESLAWLANFLLFALFLLVAARRGVVTVMLAAVAGSLLVQGVQVLYQVYVSLPTTREWIHAGMAGNEIDFQNPAAVSRVLSSEPFSTFLHANALGGWLVSAGLASAGLLAGWLVVRAAQRYRFRVAVIFSWIPIALLFTWAFLLSGSKGAYIAGAVAVAGMLLVAPPFEGRAGRWLRLAGAATLLLMAGGALALWLVPEMPGRGGMAASIQVRLGYWRPAATMASGNPLFGVGPGKFGALYTQFKGPLAEESKSAHSAFMETVAEQGLAGLLLLFSFWGWTLWRLLRGVRAADVEVEGLARGERLKHLAMALIAGLFFTCVAAHWKLSGIVWWSLLLLGLLWTAGFVAAAWPRARAEDPSSPQLRRLVQWALAAAVAAFLIHSAADMGMSLRSLIGPALILAALGLCRAGCSELVLDGRKVWLAAAAVAGLTVTSGLLAAREWRRGEAFAVVQDAARDPNPALFPAERRALLKMRRERVSACEEKLNKWRPGDGQRDPLRRARDVALKYFRDMVEKDFPRLTPRERNLVLAERMEAALEVDPHNWPLTLGCGFTKHLLANLAKAEDERRMWLFEAEASLLRAVQLAPARTRPTRDLARFYLFWSLRGRSEWAQKSAEHYARLAELYPLSGPYRLEFGDAKLLGGSPERAAKIYRRALETSRGVGDEAIHLSILLENYNRLKWSRFMLAELARRLDAAIEKQPANAALLYRRAMVEVGRGKFAAALRIMQLAAAADPDDAQLLLFVGYCHRLAGEHQKALETYRQAGTLEKRSSRKAGPGAVGRARHHTLRMHRIEMERKQRPARKAGSK
jgi:tetratricopeptide (TPR) repeat protein